MTKDSQQLENGPQLQQIKQPIDRLLTDRNIAQNQMLSHQLTSVNVKIAENVMIAMYGYNAKHEADLSFRKGEN